MHEVIVPSTRVLHPFVHFVESLAIARGVAILINLSLILAHTKKLHSYFSFALTKKENDSNYECGIWTYLFGVYPQLVASQATATNNHGCRKNTSPCCTHKSYIWPYIFLLRYVYPFLWAQRDRDLDTYSWAQKAMLLLFSIFSVTFWSILCLLVATEELR